jgi:hypothetical protein
MTTISQQQIVIPIGNSFSCILSRDEKGVVELSFVSMDGEPIRVPSDLYVIASRFGTIRTAFNQGTRYVLGFHDTYTVWYKEVVLWVEPNTVMDIRIFRDGPLEPVCTERNWYRLTTQVA